MEDREIIELYWKRSERAITETDKKYGKYCAYIAYGILNDREDAKEIVNDTYLKTWNTVPPKNPSPLKAYLGMICRQLAFNLYEARGAKKRSAQMSAAIDELAECVPDNAASVDMSESLALRDALNRFVATLPPQSQRVFVRRYWYAASIAEICKAYGMKKSAVTVTLTRTREKLREYLKKEGIGYDR